MASLVSDEHKIPVIVERLIVAIETHGMFTVGVYRKSGATAKVKQLKQNIDSGKEGQYPALASLDCLRVELFENAAQSGWSVLASAAFFFLNCLFALSRPNDGKVPDSRFFT